MKRQASLACLVVTAVVEIAVFFGLVIIWRWQRSTQVGKVESTICIRNDTFVSSVGKSEMTKGLESKGDQVCGELSDVLDRIIKEMVVEKYDSNLSPERSNLDLSVVGCTQSLENHPSLRLEEITSHAEPVQGKASKVFWQSGRTAVPELMYLEEEGSVYIKKAGLYYVLSQLSLDTESKNKTTGHGDFSTKHIVYAISYEKGEQVILMERSMSSCEITTESSEQTSHMAAVFSLQERDRLFVATSHPGSLIKGKGRNYFTVYAI